MKPIIISGFAGIGKSHFYELNKECCSDSDSSKFPKDNFPHNYINHLKNLISQNKLKYILISTHQEVRDALVAEGIEFVCVFPKRESKQEYLERYKERGSSDMFISIFNTKWDSFIDGMEAQTKAKHIVLQAGEYLSDVIEQL